MSHKRTTSTYTVVPQSALRLSWCTQTHCARTNTQAGNISEHSLSKNLKLLVECGEFLFARLPQDFDLVMGVTGTLETMSPAERRIVKDDYQIKRMVYMPSVYGKNQVVEKLIAVEDTEVSSLENSRTYMHARTTRAHNLSLSRTRF